MYDDEFDTDWDSLTIDEASHRAYALGVSEALGDPRPREYKRIEREIPSAYNRSIVELAFEEGRTRARKLRSEAEDDEDVWTALVEADPITRGFGDRGDSGPPDALNRAEMFQRSDDDLERLTLPDFLTSRRG